MRAWSIFALLVCACGAAPGQNPQTSTRPAFEVASIRPTHTSEWAGLGACLTPEPTSGPCPGRFYARAANVRMLIEYAYHVRKIYMSGGPSWISSYPDVEALGALFIKAPTPFHWNLADGRFDVDAKGDSTASPEQIRLMVQSLLEDRFHLRVHREMKELPLFELVVARNGPKLQEAADCGPSEVNCGVTTTHPVSFGLAKTARRVSMSSWAEYLAALPDYVGISRPVLNKTGLTRFYDFTLEYAVGPNSDGPSIFTALQDQLGLRLEQKRGQVEVFVIDSVERPSEN
jgi:uncharacterized protein (TIGR03435 family)